MEQETSMVNQLNLAHSSAIDKKEWETFWRLFNLFQSDNFIKSRIEDTERQKVMKMDGIALGSI
jgi:hypothetical protein